MKTTHIYIKKILALTLIISQLSGIVSPIYSEEIETFPITIVEAAEASLEIPTEVMAEVEVQDEIEDLVDELVSTSTATITDLTTTSTPATATTTTEVIITDDVEVQEATENLVDELVSTSTASTSTTTPDLTSTSTATTTTTITEVIVTDDVGVQDEIEDLVDELVSTSTATTTTTDLTTTSTPSTATTTTEINTGNAVSVANMLNIVNTNLINSDGYIVFANMFDPQSGTIDFRNPASSTISCGILNCDGGEVKVNLVNDAYIDNGVAILAVTGLNEISGADNAEIRTGDAYAGLNLVNIANVNLIDSNYMLIAVNAFKGVDGDIVFPSLSKFVILENGSQPEEFLSNITDLANIENNVTTDAHTGDNETHSANSSQTETGDAHSMTNLFNQINSSLIGGNTVSLLFRITGEWIGEITGLPDGFETIRGDDGSIYIYASSSREFARGLLDINATNTAHINNNITVEANTGDNSITDANTALVATGNAFAGVNLINIANANIVSKNWMLAIINIFGDFKGDISFGRPDLWVGGRVEQNRDIRAGSELTYTLTVVNNGDAPSNNVILKDIYNAAQQTIVHSSEDYDQQTQGNIAWSIGSLQPGQTKEITYKMKVAETVSENIDMQSNMEVRGHEKDNNTSDNTDVLVVRTTRTSTQGTGPQTETHALTATTPNTASVSEQQNNDQNQNESSGGTIESLQVERVTASSTAIVGGEVITQRLIIRNPYASEIPSVVVQDILHGVKGNVIRKENFDLGTLLPYEEVTITYDIALNRSAEIGRYSLSTLIKKPGSIDSLIPFNGVLQVIVREEIIPMLSQAEAISGTFKNLSNTPQVFAAMTDVPQIPISETMPISKQPMQSLPKYFLYYILLIIVLYYGIAIRRKIKIY